MAKNAGQISHKYLIYPVAKSEKFLKSPVKVQHVPWICCRFGPLIMHLSSLARV